MTEIVSDQTVHQHIIDEQQTRYCDKIEAIGSLQQPETKTVPSTNIVNIPTARFVNKYKRAMKKHSIILKSTSEKQKLLKKQQQKLRRE